MSHTRQRPLILFRKYCFGPRTCSRIPYVACPSPNPDRQGCKWGFGSTFFDSRYFKGVISIKNKRKTGQVLQNKVHLRVASLGTSIFLILFMQLIFFSQWCLSNKVEAICLPYMALLILKFTCTQLTSTFKLWYFVPLTFW